ncbi:MAG: hypothetical protein NC394_04030 [Bacteroides sp.]|nr:hypothetical protein [Bacteroides sp.]
MNKKIISVLTASAVLLTSLTACKKNEINGVDPSAPVARIEAPPEGARDRFTITYKDFFSEYDFYMARGGYTEEHDPELAETQRDNTIRYLVQERVILYLAEQMGITSDSLTEQEKQGIDEIVQENIDSWCDSYSSDAASELGQTYTEEELRNKELELFSAFLAESGLTTDSFYTWEINGAIRDKFVEGVSDSISDETVLEFVQDTVNDAMDKYENDLAVFEQSYTAFYVPEGSRRVQQILVKIDDTSISEVAAYRKDGDDQKADEILNEALQKIRFRIDEAYSKLESGESWETVQAEYNDETDTNGVDYMLYPKSTTVKSEVINAAMAIPQPGEYSPVCKSDSGYFIIYYTGKAELSDERIEELNRQAREFLASEESYKRITDFMTEYPYLYDYELLDLEEGSLEMSSDSTSAQSDEQ